MHEGGLTWLALDNVESRYLLASAADGSVAAYDTPYLSSASRPQKQLLFKLGRNSPGGHRFTVAGVTWYPIDTGLFVTGSFDQSVKVLLTNGVFRLQFCVPKAGLSFVPSRCLCAGVGHKLSAGCLHICSSSASPRCGNVKLCSRPLLDCSRGWRPRDTPLRPQQREPESHPGWPP